MGSVDCKLKKEEEKVQTKCLGSLNTLEDGQCAWRASRGDQVGLKVGLKVGPEKNWLRSVSRSRENTSFIRSDR